MIAAETGRFTVGVFPDVVWAERGLAAVKQAGLPTDALTILAKATPEVSSLIEQALGVKGEQFEMAVVGPVVAYGPLIAVLQGQGQDLKTLGLSGTMRRVGFQSHDAGIFEVLTARGGVLVAVHSEPRAADVLAILFSYGGANAAIGAWTGRV